MNPSKNINKNRYLPLFILPFILASALGLWLNFSQTDYITAYSENGVWDLREADFSEGSVFRLSGPAEIIPNALLNPEEFALREDEIILGNRHNYYSTARLRLLLPEEGWFTFSRLSPRYSYRLYVNGEWVLNVGVPGTSRETTEIGVDYIAFTAMPADGVVEIVQQASNFVHREGIFHGAFYVGRGHFQVTGRHSYDRSILMGSFLGMFFVYLMLYFLLNRQRANLYVALFCLTWFFRLGVMQPSESAPFTHIFSWFTWFMAFRVEYISIPATAALSVAIINALFPGVLQKYYRYAVYAASAVFALWFCFADTMLMSAVLLNHMMRIFGVAALYIAVRLVWKVRRVNLAQGIFLAGVGLFLYFIVAEFLSRLGLAWMPLFVELGMSTLIVFLFSLCTAAAVFVSTSAEVESAKEAERRLAADNAALVRLGHMRTDLIANVTHETTTPLAVLSVYADLIANELRSKDISVQVTKDLNTISEEAQRIAEMIDELNRHAQDADSRLSKTRLDLVKLIEGAVRLYSPIIKRTGSEIDIEIPGGLDVYACTGEITQVMFNLLQNARKHTEKGKISIAAGYVGGSLAQITVSDTGQGIQPELLPKVFERGAAGVDIKGDTGSGLGLALCKEIIKAHGGEIDVESEYGKGTAVRFTLPVWKEGMGI